ncbi:hypothetical protein HOC01_01175 [archaeon]|jgi:hypothetical protein|nr:hypothetical protein [archaeon]MBT6698068.1 hypothetical protein [archaeon]
MSFPDDRLPYILVKATVGAAKDYFMSRAVAIQDSVAERGIGGLVSDLFRPETEASKLLDGKLFATYKCGEETIYVESVWV